MRRISALLALCLLAAVALLRCGGRAAPPPVPPAGDIADAAAEPNVPVDRAAGDMAAVDSAAPVSLSLAEREGAPRSLSRVQLQLEGLHEEAPWTEPLAVRAEGRAGRERFEQEWHLPADDQGRAVFELPEWATAAVDFDLRVDACDPNYAPLAERVRNRLQGGGTWPLRVYPQAVLTGRVVDHRGDPVPAAEVRALVAASGDHRKVGVASTAADGTYVLQVLADEPLLVIATAMRPMQISGRQLTGRNGAIANLGDPRDDLQPAELQTNGRLGQPARLPDLVLRPADRIEGRLCWHDGRPVAGARLQLRLLQPTRWRLWDLHVRLIDGRLATEPTVLTETDGSFAVAAPAGAQVSLRVVELPDVMQLEQPEFTVESPARPRLVLEDNLRVVQVMVQGIPAAGAEVECDGHGRTSADGDGRIQLWLPGDPVVVRARYGTMASAAATIDMATRRITYLELQDTGLVDACVELECEHRVRQATFDWQPLPTGEPVRFMRQRSDRDGPFRMPLTAGRYRLQVSAAAGERNGSYLLPAVAEVDVGAATLCHLDVTLGGRVMFDVTDRRGLRLGGRFTLSAQQPTGGDVLRDVDLRTRCQPEGGTTRIAPPGELPDGGPAELIGVLPAGSYTVHLDLGERGVHRSDFRVTERTTTTIQLSVP